MPVIFRWDLDKTYLDTRFDSVRDLVRTALEPAALKEAVPGASSLLKAIQSTNPEAIAILSGSPEQMRSVLEAKLRLDGIRWDSLILKPSLHQLLRGRFHFLRDQIGYKLGALVEDRVKRQSEAVEVLFGDDAEADALIYSLYADLMRRQVDRATLRVLMNRAQLYPDQQEHILSQVDALPRGSLVKRIFIRLDRLSSPQQFAHYGQRLCPVFNYFQAALVLLEDEAISANACLEVGMALERRLDFHPNVLVESFSDIARRHYLSKRSVRALRSVAEHYDGSSSFFSFLETAQSRLPEERVVELPTIDYIEAFHRDEERSAAGKKRAGRKDR